MDFTWRENTRVLETEWTGIIGRSEPWPTLVTRNLSFIFFFVLRAIITPSKRRRWRLGIWNRPFHLGFWRRIEGTTLESPLHKLTTFKYCIVFIDLIRLKKNFKGFLFLKSNRTMQVSFTELNTIFDLFELFEIWAKNWND